MDEHRAQGLETSKPVGATSHSGSDVHPKNQEGAAADLVTHTTKAAGEVVEHAKAAAEEIIDHAKSTAGEALTSMAEDVADKPPRLPSEFGTRLRRWPMTYTALVESMCHVKSKRIP